MDIPVNKKYTPLIIWKCRECGSRNLPTYQKTQVFSVDVDDKYMVFVSTVDKIRDEDVMVCPDCGFRDDSYKIERGGTICKRVE